MGLCRSILISSGLLLSQAAFAVSITWDGGASGDWNNAANWNPAVVPDNDFFTDYDVLIDGNPGQDTTVTLGISLDVDSLVIDANDLLRINSGQLLEVLTRLAGPGTVVTEGSAQLAVNTGTVEDITKQGSGTLSAFNSTVRNIDNASGVLRLTSPFIDGDIVNNGLIELDGSGSFTNATISGNGEIAATNAFLGADSIGSTLTIAGTQRLTGTTSFPSPLTIASFGLLVVDGTLQVDSPRLEINNDMTLTSSTTGNLITGAGTIVVLNDSAIENIVHDSPSGNGALFVADGSVENVTHNGGFFSISDSTLAGTITNNAVTALGGSTFGSFDNVRIDGNGELRLGGTLSAQNLGSTITFGGNQRMTGGPGATLTINNFAQVLLDGGIQVDDARLQIDNGSVLTTLTSGSIDTINTGIVALGNSTVSNITHTSSDGTGALFVTNGTIENVINNGGLLSINDSTLAGTITNNALTAFGGSTFNSFDNVRIDGSGELQLSGFMTAQNIGSTITFGGNQRMTGGPGSTLTINNFAQVLLDGGIQVDGARLQIDNGSILTTLTSGSIDTTNTGIVALGNSSVSNITHTSSDGTGALFVTNGTIENVINNGGLLSINDSTLAGTITNNALTALGGSTFSSFDNVRIDGNGELQLGGVLSAQNIGSTITFGGNQRMTGGPGSTLTINNFAQVLLDGGIQVDAARLQIDNGSILTTLTSGSIDTTNTGIVALGNSTVRNITHASSDGSGGLFVTNGTIENVINDGGLLSINDSTLAGTITNNAVTALGGSTFSSFDNVRIDGNGELRLGGFMTAQNIGSTITFGGNQRMTGGSGSPLTINGFANVLIDGGIQVDDGRLEVRTGSLSSLTTATIETTNVGVVVVDDGATVERIVHTGDGSGALFVNDSTIRDVVNQRGSLLLSTNVTLDGHIVNADRMSSSQPLQVGANTRLTQDNGRITAGNINVDGGGILDGGGLIEGDLTIGAGGSIGADSLTKTMAIIGGFDMAGLMQMELAGTNLLAGEYDHYTVFDDTLDPGTGGNVLLRGTLELMLLPSYTPTAGDTFDLISADQITDLGLALNFLSLTPTLDFVSSIVVEASREILRVSLFETQIDPVPVPGAVWLFATGLMALFGFSRRRNSGRS